MEDEHRQKMNLVWAGLFLSSISMFGTGVVVAFAQGAVFEIASGVAFILAVLVIVFNTTWLLTTPGASPSRMRRGKTLVWLSFTLIAVGGALGCIALALS